MKGMKFLIAVGCLAALIGCAGIFGRSTDDPAVKLKWASELYASQDDPVPAERLIIEALETYKKQNDQPGMAEAYRQYGLFFRSNAVGKFAEHYREEGFLDRTANFKDRYNRAIVYFNKSKDIFIELKQYDALSNLYISLAKTYDLMNRLEEACSAFDQSLESHDAFTKANPDAKSLRSEETENYEEYIGIMKKQAGCP